MSYLINPILARFNNLDLSNPLVYLDIIFALVLLVSFLFYIKKFPVFRVVIGIIFLFFCSALFWTAGFLFTSLILGLATNLILISMPLIFAPEIRHYLEKIGRFSFIRIPKLTSSQKSKSFIRNLADSVYEMSERKIGATIVIQRRTGLAQTVETGYIIDARFGAKLLQTIFFPKSPLHDGAVIIKGDRIFAAGCLLPISSDVVLDPPFGTRHKSGLSITRDTDAVVILVSEQRGHVSLAENGKLEINLEKSNLISRLEKLL